MTTGYSLLYPASGARGNDLAPQGWCPSPVTITESAPGLRGSIRRRPLTWFFGLANLLWRRVLGREAPSSVQHTALGLATVPLTLLASTVALWAALRI